MAKVSAERFSLEGDKYLGRLYADMDCQTFVERAMYDVGLDMDLKGSNAWLREVTKNGWVGSPEECKKLFGSVPKGALLFIHAFDGGEEARGYHDGLGNASHIGIYTGRSGADMVGRARAAGASEPEKWNFGDGAIHSSSSRKHVATSNFAGKTISGGGWNKVGLYNKFTYGEKIDRLLAEISGGAATSGDDDTGTQEDEAMYTAILEGGSTDFPINIRKKPSGDLQDKLPQGTKVDVLSESGNWCKIRYTKGSQAYTGYVKGDFVTVADEDPADDSGVPAEDFGDDEKVTITFSVTAAEAATALPVLEKIVDAIVDKVGRG